MAYRPQRRPRSDIVRGVRLSRDLSARAAATPGYDSKNGKPAEAVPDRARHRFRFPDRSEPIDTSRANHGCCGRNTDATGGWLMEPQSGVIRRVGKVAPLACPALIVH